MERIIYLIRHAEAEDRKPNLLEKDRRLTEKGKKIFAEFLEKKKAILQREESYTTWTSPMVRAVETAELFATVVSSTEVQTKDFLAGSAVDSWMEIIQTYEFSEPLVLVGHEPALGMFLEILTGSKRSLAKGEIVRVSGDESEAKVDWKLKP